jgi:hypothetical protein
MWCDVVITNSTPAAPNSRRQERLTREERGIALFEEHSGEIQQLGRGLYSVPSCSGRADYLVEYGAGVESCECKDFEFHGANYPCKHLIAAALFAARRRRVVRTIAPVLMDGVDAE